MKNLLLGCSILLTISAFAQDNEMIYHEKVVIALLKGSAGSKCIVQAVTANHSKGQIVTHDSNTGFNLQIPTVTAYIKDQDSPYAASGLRLNFVEIESTKTEKQNGETSHTVVYRDRNTQTTVTIGNDKKVSGLRSVLHRNGEVFIDCK